MAAVCCQHSQLIHAAAQTSFLGVLVIRLGRQPPAWLSTRNCNLLLLSSRSAVLSIKPDLQPGTVLLYDAFSLVLPVVYEVGMNPCDSFPLSPREQALLGASEAVCVKATNAVNTLKRMCHS